jgi:small GTP-binding protein
MDRQRAELMKMDLKQYEHTKFELSAILRSIALDIQGKRPDLQRTLEDLFARLAEDRFNLVVVGRFSRGKTSLMNAILESERLPTGIVPLTSVITTVGYGTKECAFIEYEGRHLSTEISLDALPEYITQHGNPGNARHVAIARVELPAEILRRGFYFVDTPGLGSTILENTRTTERFLPEADAFMLVTSYDSPLSEEELAILHRVASSNRPVFLVLNKHDLASPEERNEVLEHVRRQAYQVFGDNVPQLFSISAREALEANKLHDKGRLMSSGLPYLKAKLIEFLVNEKQAQFLLRMCGRVADALGQLSNLVEEAGRLRALLERIAGDGPAVSSVYPVTAIAADGIPRFFRCTICERIEQEMYAFLCQYQYDVMARQDVQAGLAERGGLCEFHTWQYESIASPRGTCIGFAGVLEQLARRLRDLASTQESPAIPRGLERLKPTLESCDLCRSRSKIELTAVGEAARPLVNEETQIHRFAGVCIPHLRLLAQFIPDSGIMRKLLVREADTLERVSEDMQRHVLKHDGVRRFLASDEETTADRRALMLLAGHRNVNGR